MINFMHAFTDLNNQVSKPYTKVGSHQVHQSKIYKSFVFSKGQLQRIMDNIFMIDKIIFEMVDSENEGKQAFPYTFLNLGDTYPY